MTQVVGSFSSGVWLGVVNWTDVLLLMNLVCGKLLGREPLILIVPISVCGN